MGKEQSATGKALSVACARDGEKCRDRDRRGKDISEPANSQRYGRNRQGALRFFIAL
jgi:hypothetical protein